MLSLKSSQNRKCYGCGNRLKQEGLRLLMSSMEIEHCQRCSAFITRRGVLGHLIREKRELQQAYSSLEEFNTQLKCALNRKKVALDQAIEDIEKDSALGDDIPEGPVSKFSNRRQTSDAKDEGHVRDDDSFEFVDHLLTTGKAAHKASPMLVPPPFTVPVITTSSSSTSPSPVKEPEDPDHCSPDMRTKMWVEQTESPRPRDELLQLAKPVPKPSAGPPATVASPDISKSLTWSACKSGHQSPDETTPKSTCSPNDPPLSPVAQGTGGHTTVTTPARKFVPPQPVKEAPSYHAPLDPPARGSPTAVSASARGTNFTAFTQMSGLESRASMSDRGSDHSFTSRISSHVSSRPSTAISTMQTLKQSRNVRASIADDISFLDNLIGAYKRAPKKDGGGEAQSSMHALAKPPPVATPTA